MALLSLLLLSCLLAKASTNASASASASASATFTDDTIRKMFMQRMDSATLHNNKQQLSLARKLQQTLLSAASSPRHLSDSTSLLNISQYALKYIGCQNIKSFSDDLATDNSANSVLALQKFVMFRLCDANLCSTYNKYGCSQNFGSYMIDMETYLKTMAEYHFDKYQEYCATCENCMDSATNDDNSTDDDTTTMTCEYEAACENYKSACSQYGTSTTQYENFFTCTQFNVGNNVGYLGPLCGADGTTIRIGIFNDANCNEYIGDIVDLEQYTGMTFDDDGLAFYDNAKCISCVDKNEYDLYEDNLSGTGVYELCTMLYDAAGKCNRYLNVANWEGTYASYEQEKNENKVCNFIDSLVENHYDETGEIVLGYQFNASNWKDYNEYYTTARFLAPSQLVGLVASALLVLFLALYSFYLRRKALQLKQSLVPWHDEWHPNQASRNASDAGRLSRTQSYIMAGRSNSNFSFQGGTDAAYA